VRPAPAPDCASSPLLRAREGVPCSRMRPRWLLPLGLFVASCSGASNDDSSEDGSGDLDLTYRSFYSESLEGRELVPNSVLSLYFNPGGLSADDGCNQTYGDYHFEDDRLVFQPAGQSDDECSTWLVEQAIWFVMFLQMSPTIRLVEPRLILSNGREILTLNDDQEPIPDRPLAGTNWVGSGIDEGAGLMGGPSLSNLTVRFGSDGRFDAFSGCLGVTLRATGPSRSRTSSPTLCHVPIRRSRHYPRAFSSCSTTGRA
jgi:heat shock protein HslJ